MEASAKTIRKILESGDQYLIPFFQRSYSWKKKHWDRLWSDILNLADDFGAQIQSQHFLGPLVCTLARATPGEIAAYQLIDGQQRLTTLSVLLAALRDVCKENGNDKLYTRIHESYLVHRFEDEHSRYKIVPRLGDREAFTGIINERREKEHKRLGIDRAWRFFRRQIESYIEEGESDARLASLLTIVTDRLSMVVITIDGENPYEIFESLNSTGLPLEESDLIRNHIFMQIDPPKQEAFNREHWKAFEELFDHEEVDPAKTATKFYRNYLMREGEYSKAKATFVDFKRQNKERDITPVAQVGELRHFSALARTLRSPGECEDKQLSHLLSHIAQLEVNTAHPLLLALLNLHATNAISTEELYESLNDIISFVLRRSLCSESTKQYFRWFPEAIKSVGATPKQDLRNYLLERGWPDDKTVYERLATFPIYRREPKKLRLILERLEQAEGHKEQVAMNKLSVEHVLPQTLGANADGERWRTMLGERWMDAHEKRLHTLGNLTLTGYNQSLSNKSFDRKRKELAKSHVELNRYFANLEVWDESAIRERTESLASKLCELWPRPAGGPKYVPTLDLDEDLQRFNTEYWTAFIERLVASGTQLESYTDRSQEYLSFKGPKQGYWYYTEFSREEKEIYVGLYASGKQRVKRMAVLWDALSWEEQEGMEKKLNSAIEWSAQNCEMYATREESDPGNRESWPEQHQWLVQAFTNIEAWLSPVLPELSVRDYEPNSDFETSADDVSEDADDFEPADLREDDEEVPVP